MIEIYDTREKKMLSLINLSIIQRNGHVNVVLLCFDVGRMLSVSSLKFTNKLINFFDTRTSCVYVGIACPALKYVPTLRLFDRHIYVHFRGKMHRTRIICFILTAYNICS